MTTRHLILCVNTESRQGKEAAPEALAILTRLGFAVSQIEFAAAAQLVERVRQVTPAAEALVVGGGDGTINTAIDVALATNLPLGILPLGTANDLARTLGIANELQSACEVIAQGATRRIDIATVNEQTFANVASIGLTAEITKKLTKERKSRWGVLAYFITAIAVLRYSRPFTVWITHEGGTERVKTLQVSIGNGRHYGGGLTIDEDARIDDETLDLYSLEISRWWQLFALLPSMRQGTLKSWPRVRTLRGTWFTLTTKRPRNITSDGEITSKTPAKFSLRPKALTVFAPVDSESD